MPGLLAHNLMPEDRADEKPPASRRAGSASAPALPVAPPMGTTAVACSVHKEVRYSDGSLRCERCFSIRYPQGRLF